MLQSLKLDFLTGELQGKLKQRDANYLLLTGFFSRRYLLPVCNPVNITRLQGLRRGHKGLSHSGRQCDVVSEFLVARL